MNLDFKFGEIETNLDFKFDEIEIPKFSLFGAGDSLETPKKLIRKHFYHDGRELFDASDKREGL